MPWQLANAMLRLFATPITTPTLPSSNLLDIMVSEYCPTFLHLTRKTDVTALRQAPVCWRQALTVLAISMAMVIGPTPPGTGVMARHLGTTSS